MQEGGKTIPSRLKVEETKQKQHVNYKDKDTTYPESQRNRDVKCFRCLGTGYVAS